jgi:hypothetical protein
MAEKKKNDEVTTAPALEEKLESKAKRPAAPAPQPVAPAPKPPAPPARGGLLGRAKPIPAPLPALASATGTSPIVLAALKAAYGWTDRTRLTRREFLRKRDEWLARPASEV